MYKKEKQKGILIWLQILLCIILINKYVSVSDIIVNNNNNSNFYKYTVHLMKTVNHSAIFKHEGT